MLKKIPNIILQQKSYQEQGNLRQLEVFIYCLKLRDNNKEDCVCTLCV